MFQTFSAGRVQRPTITRPYFAYFAYFTYFDLFINLSLADQWQSAIVYKRREQAQVLYVLPVSSVLGRLPFVLMGATRTIPCAMRREAADLK
jgi:hypothetical protein